MKEKKMQRALMHFNKKENRQTVREALEAAGRPELIPVLLGKKVDEKNKRPDTRNRKRKKRV